MLIRSFAIAVCLSVALAGARSGATQLPAPAASYQAIAVAARRVPDVDRLTQLVEAYTAERSLPEPIEERVINGRRALLIAQGDARRASERRIAEAFVAAVRSIRVDALPFDRTLDWRLLMSEAARRARPETASGYLLPDTPSINLGRIRSLSQGPIDDYESLLSWLNGVAIGVDRSREALQEGLRQGLTADRATMTGHIDWIRSAIPTNPLESPYLAAFKGEPPSPADVRRQQAMDAAIDMYRRDIVPAFNRYLAFANGPYLAHTRPTRALGGTAAGREVYAQSVDAQVGSGLTPDDIHAAGLQEVQRLEREIETVGRRAGYAGAWNDVLRSVRAACGPAVESDDALKQAQAVATAAEGRLPALFGAIPKTPYVIKTVTTLPLAAGGGGSRPGSLRDARPGEIQLQVPVLNRCVLVNQVLHEGYPGHLLQQHRALETEIPEWRRFSSLAFREGWAHYATGLRAELGFPPDDHVALERLGGELMMAVRAVIDTGIHAKGWTRDRAIEYYKTTIAIAPDDRVEAEVDAAMNMQARRLIYMVGQRRLMAIRAYAEAQLGARFDRRAFHDELLRNGPLPLDALDDHMRDWVAHLRGNR